jgi:hypothetical protein
MGSKAKDRFVFVKKKIKQTQITKFNSRRQKDKEVRSVREIGIIQRERERDRERGLGLVCFKFFNPFLLHRL